jgi:hypothetical protein
VVVEVAQHRQHPADNGTTIFVQKQKTWIP